MNTGVPWEGEQGGRVRNAEACKQDIVSRG